MAGRGYNITPRGAWWPLDGARDEAQHIDVRDDGVWKSAKVVWTCRAGTWWPVWSTYAAPVTNVVATVDESNWEVVLTWDPPEHPIGTGYIVRRPDGSVVRTIYNLRQRRTVDRAPVPIDGAYTVQTILQSLRSEKVPSNSVLLDTDPAGLAYKVMDSGTSAQSVVLVWSNPPKAPTAWRVYASIENDAGGFDPFRLIGETVGGATRFVTRDASVMARDSHWMLVPVVGSTEGTFDPNDPTSRPSVLAQVPATPPTSITVDVPPAPAPGNKAEAYFVVRWTPPPGGGVNQYRLEWRPQGYTYWSLISQDNTTVSRRILWFAGQSSEFRVRSVDPNGDSEWVEAVRAWLPNDAPPAPPESVSLIRTDRIGELRLTWSRPSSGSVTGYWVQFSHDGTNWVSAPNNANPNYYTFAGDRGPRWMRVASLAETGPSVPVARSATPIWDTTPPGAATITSFKPESSFGRLVVRATMPNDADLDAYAIDAYDPIAGRGWRVKNWTPVRPGFPIEPFAIGTFPAGKTMHVRILTRDKASHETASPYATYTVTASPMVINAVWSRSWRNTSGGEWDPSANGDVYQGYYTSSHGPYRGCFGYGTAPSSRLRAANSSLDARLTVVSATVRLHRRGCGVNTAGTLTVGVHNIVSDPGRRTNAAAPSFDSLTDIPGLTYGEVRDVQLPAAVTAMLCSPSNEWNGIGLFKPGGTPYVCLYGTDDNPANGQLKIYHLG